MKDWGQQLKQFLKIGIPIYGSQMSYMGMSVTDTIIAGQASSRDLAGLAIGNALTLPIFFLLGGILFAVTPIVAHLFGEKKFEDIGEKVRQILWISIVIGLIGFLLYRNLSTFLPFFNIDPSISMISDGYLKALSYGFFANMIFMCLRCYSEGMGLTLPVFFVAFAGMLLNIPLDIIFVYGYFGLPPMGGVGCGIATSINLFIGLVVLILIIIYKKEYAKTKLFWRFSKPTRQTSIELLRLGLPIGLGIFVEVSMFSGAALILASLGEGVVSAHTIAISIVSVLFMLPASIGHAAATIIGKLVGEKEFVRAKDAALIAILICLLGSFFNTAILLAFRGPLVGIYTGSREVFEIAYHLLMFGAIFQIMDGIQMAALGSLRGYKDTFIPMCMLIFSYWFLALPVGSVLTFYQVDGSVFGPSGIWIGMVIGLSIFSSMIVLRLRYVSKKFILGCNK